VKEDSEAGTVVGQLVAVDPDNARSVRQTHSYTLTEDAGGRFAVQGDTLVVCIKRRNLSRGEIALYVKEIDGWLLINNLL
jgi:hypothetical protein